MPPLSLNDSVGISASVGTWLGSLFTGIGLVAVVSQLRTFLSSTSAGRERFISRAAGAWSACFVNKQILQGKGDIKESAPALAGWIHNRYREAGAIKLTQCATNVAGTSSWSKLLGQCYISPDQLLQDGGPAAAVYPPGSTSSQNPIQADMQIEDGNLLYGMSSAEFAAILVLSGFPTTDFSSKGKSFSVKYLGTIHLASHGVFSQIAHFDSHGGSRVTESPSDRRVQSVPVQGSIHLALGILKMSEKRHGREWIVIPQQCSASEALSTLPLAAQLNSARYNLEQLVWISGGSIITYTSQSTHDSNLEKHLMMRLVGQPGPLRFHEALLAAYAIDALVPWSLLPVAPDSFARAFELLLRPCIASRTETVGVLIQKLQNIRSADWRARARGWQDMNEQVSSLNRIGDPASEAFCKSSNYCAYYYDAMAMVFDAVDLPMEYVRRSLAALVSWQVLHSIDSTDSQSNHDGGDGGDTDRKKFFDSMLSHLSLKPQSNSEEHGDITWAVKIYATYVWAWLHDRQHTDGDFVSRFHRRVFFE